jgi:hypothetical protein
MCENITKILKKAFWLKESEKEIIFKALTDHHWDLSMTDLEKLCKILSVIPLSENSIRKEGKKPPIF